jgi:hypothetical protein
MKTKVFCTEIIKTNLISFKRGNDNEAEFHEIEIAIFHEIEITITISKLG